MKEILIPYRGQSNKVDAPTEEDKEREEKKRRFACIQMLDGFIKDQETKAMNTNKIKRVKVEKNYRQEATFYFEDNEFDYHRSVKAYREDMDHEIKQFQKEKEDKKLRKKSKKKGSKVGDNYESVSTQGCQKDKGCSIF